MAAPRSSYFRDCERARLEIMALNHGYSTGSATRNLFFAPITAVRTLCKKAQLGDYDLSRPTSLRVASLATCNGLAGTSTA